MLLSGVVFTNLVKGPPTQCFPAGKSQSLPQDQSCADLGKHLPHPESLSLFFQLCQHRTLCSQGPGAELALPPNRWMTSQRLTPTGHQESPEGGLRLLLGRLPTLAPWLTSTGWQRPGSSRKPGAHATSWVTLGKTEPQLAPGLNRSIWLIYTSLTGRLSKNKVLRKWKVT